MDTKTEHIVIRGIEGDWYCERCKTSYIPPSGFQPLYMYVAMLKAFIKAHEHCQPEDEAND